MRIQGIKVSAARNLGLKLAKGRYIAFTDDDCIVCTDWLKRLEKRLEEGYDAVGGSIINPTDRYIAWSQYILNFSYWFPEMALRGVRDIPTANIAYRKASIAGNRFPDFHPDRIYEDSIFNHNLIKEGKRILFDPEIRVNHHTWESQYGLRKFYSIQKKSALGFASGGYRVHGRTGEVLIRLRILNILSPRLILVIGRAAICGYLMRFLYHFPLILSGEIYKGWVIMTTKSEGYRS